MSRGDALKGLGAAALVAPWVLLGSAGVRAADDTQTFKDNKYPVRPLTRISFFSAGHEDGGRGCQEVTRRLGLRLIWPEREGTGVVLKMGWLCVGTSAGVVLQHPQCVAEDRHARRIRPQGYVTIFIAFDVRSTGRSFIKSDGTSRRCTTPCMRGDDAVLPIRDTLPFLEIHELTILSDVPWQTSAAWWFSRTPTRRPTPLWPSRTSGPTSPRSARSAPLGTWPRPSSPPAGVRVLLQRAHRLIHSIPVGCGRLAAFVPTCTKD